MRKFISLFLFSVILSSFPLFAQQIHGDFNQPWQVDTVGNGALPGQYLRPGKQPIGWQSSNVNQKVFMTVKDSTLVISDLDRYGKGGFSVKMQNKFVGLGSIGSTAPGYITLGTPWAFAVMDIPSCDGGTIGGIEYTQRPDSLIGYFKREVLEEDSAFILTYLWKGTCISTVKVNPNGGMSSDETAQVKDEARCVLGMDKPDSGNVTLIGRAEHNIKGNLADWTRISIPIEYSNSDLPEKMNIIISAGNYWDRGAIKKDNALWADDVEMICNAELKSLKLDGIDFAEFDPKIYEYTLSIDYLDAKITAQGYGANSTIQIETENQSKKIIVTDNTAKGEKTYTYTINFSGEQTILNVPMLADNCIYGSEIEYSVTSNNNEKPINISFSDDSYATYENGKIKFRKAGQITLIVTQEAGENFSSARHEEQVIINKAPLTISLNDATSIFGKTATYTFTYVGLLDIDKELANTNLKNIFTIVPTASGYDGDTKVVRTTPAGTYPIRWENTPVAPNYEITLDPTEKTLTIGKVEVTVSFNLKRKEGDVNPEFVMENFAFNGLLTADRIQNPTTKTFYPTANLLTGGEISAEFVDVIPDEESPAGSYPVKVTCTFTSNNYNFVVAEVNQLTVLKIPLLEFVNFPEEVFYGDTIYVELKTNDEIENSRYSYYKAKADENSDYKVKIKSPSKNEIIAIATGMAKIRVTLSENGEYSSNEITKEFEIKKAPLIVSTEDAKRNVGEENPEFIFTFDKLRLDDNANAVDTLLTASTDANEESLPGYYEVNIEAKEAETANYVVTTQKGKLTVMTTPTINIVNFPEIVMYGDTIIIEVETSNDIDGHTFKFEAIAVNDTLNANFASDNSAKMTAIGAGNAQISATVEEIGYYNAVTVTHDFIINKAPLTVTARNAERIIGQENPEFILLYEGFKFEDSESTVGVFNSLPIARTEADIDSPKGNYDIIVEGGVAPNYEITHINGILTITDDGVSIDDYQTEGIKIYSSNGILYIQNNSLNKNIHIFNPQGILIKTSNNTNEEISGLKLHNVYIVKVGKVSAIVIIK